jgi:hypothetical protein
MYTSVVEGLAFHYMPSTDTIGMWYNGKRIPRLTKLNGGSRQFFKLGAYFIKAEYAYSKNEGQCKSESYMAGRIIDRDKKFFTPMLACDVDEPEGVRWTMFPWVKLLACDTSTDLYKACRTNVDRLCGRYGINDVAPYVNTNWFIHNSRPLIVDCGITDEGSY